MTEPIGLSTSWNGPGNNPAHLLEQGRGLGFRRIEAYAHFTLDGLRALAAATAQHGMHIGSFAYAALARGCGSLYGFEPDPANFSLAVQNLKRFGNRAHLYQKAVWRSDRAGDALFHNGYPEGNTGGGCVLHDSGSEKLYVWTPKSDSPAAHDIEVHDRQPRR